MYSNSNYFNELKSVLMNYCNVLSGPDLSPQERLTFQLPLRRGEWASLVQAKSEPSQ